MKYIVIILATVLATILYFDYKSEELERIDRMWNSSILYCEHCGTPYKIELNAVEIMFRDLEEQLEA